MTKKKNFILPVALASLCVEQASSLEYDDSTSANPYDKAIIQPQVKVATKKSKSRVKRENRSLYNSIKSRKAEPSATIKPSNRPTNIVKKVKDIKISDKNDTSKVSKNRVTTLKNYKKLIKKIKTNQKNSKRASKRELSLKIFKNGLKNKPFYIAKKGDTLRTIAKKTKTPLAKLVKLNRFFKTSHIKVGQKIYYESSIKKSIKRDTKSKKIANRVLKVTATAYTSHAGQTDKTPFLAAWNNRIRPGMKIIAVSRDLIKKYNLTNGVKVKIKGLKGHFIVRDKMNKRFRKRIDIYMGMNKKKALQWGKKKITLIW